MLRLPLTQFGKVYQYWNPTNARRANAVFYTYRDGKTLGVVEPVTHIEQAYIHAIQAYENTPKEQRTSLITASYKVAWNELNQIAEPAPNQ
jgi:hypothetical protein